MIRELPEKWKHLRTSEEISTLLDSREYWEARRHGDPLDDEIIELDFSKYFGNAVGHKILSARAILQGRFSASINKLPDDVRARIRTAVKDHKSALPQTPCSVSDCPKCWAHTLVSIDMLEKHLATPHPEGEACNVECDHEHADHVVTTFHDHCGYLCNRCGAIRLCY